MKPDQLEVGDRLRWYGVPWEVTLIERKDVWMQQVASDGTVTPFLPGMPRGNGLLLSSEIRKGITTGECVLEHFYNAARRAVK